MTKLRTDAKGHVAFKALPAGPYKVEVYGPWRFAEDYWGGLVLFAGSCERCGGAILRLVPGPVVPEAGTPIPPTTDGSTTTPVVNPVPVTNPVPQARAAVTTSNNTSPTLADTGANVLGLTAIGALAVLAGFATTLTTRRRRKA
ncbi:LPXTG-motif cell wall anchor domain-containing protein [Actinokineospora terrae]|uniref:LPXTG-motif cell wall anchor domain-containing protein n=1 Tax=Actinokineospora terrae TaxID=155974 RepID=A0A1H9XK67_9PSEU|nr:LPXTG-motif cell wall anchor domain-containing protein [Actinokineospora terrae]